MARSSNSVSQIHPAPSPQTPQPFGVSTHKPPSEINLVLCGSSSDRLLEEVRALVEGPLRDGGFRLHGPQGMQGDELLLSPTQGRCLLLGAPSTSAALPSLVELRRRPETALLPVMLCVTDPVDAGSGLISPSYRSYLDALITPSNSHGEIVSLLGRTSKIAARLSALPAPLFLDPRGLRRLLILRFLLSRGTEQLTPKPDPQRPFGYGYPPLDLLFAPAPLLDAQSNAGYIHELDLMARGGLFSRVFTERLHACPACGDVRLLFREVCASCGSANVRRGEIIHHYRCGHAGPELSFRRGQAQGEALRCPACAETLRHIGVDYERPVALLRCQECEMLAGEGVTQARCLSCGVSHGAEAVSDKILWTYQLTPEGRSAGASGQMPVLSESSGEES